MKENTKKILQTYLRRLTNLDGRNRSLFLPRVSGDQLIDLQSLSFLNGENAFQIIRSLMARRAQKVCPVLDTRMEESNKASRKLRLLNRVDKFLFDESGARDLHVGWPFVRGRFSDDTVVRCPLLFFPVMLIEQDNSWVLRPREDAPFLLNKSFLMAYAYYNKVSPDEELLEAVFDDFDTDSTVFRTQLYQLLKDKLELHFNPDNFRDELIPFEAFKKDDLEKVTATGSLRLFPEAVLGIFPQAGSSLVTDYQTILETGDFQDLEQFFFNRRNPENDGVEENTIAEEKIFTPFDIDGSQEHALRKIKSGQSIVVQGPPGTGKSQLIANLMADAMASGKRVLLVSQKRAALDVVYERMRTLGIEDFLGLVHDHRSDRKNIFEKVSRQIDSVEDFRARNRSVDVIYLERRFVQLCRRIDSIVETLEDFRKELFSEKECGISAKELYLSSDPSADTINLKQEYQYFDFAFLHEFISRLKSYVAYAKTFELGSYPWKDRKSFAELHRADLQELIATIDQVVKTTADVADITKKIIGIPLETETALHLIEKKEQAFEMLTLLPDVPTFHYFKIMNAVPVEETSTLWLANMERVCLNCFDDVGVEHTVPTHQLGAVQAALQHRMKARRSLINRLRWEFSSPQKILLRRVMAANHLEFNKAGWTILESMIDNRLNLEHHFTSVKNMGWLIDLPMTFRKEDLEKWFAIQKSALDAKLIFSSLKELKEHLNLEAIDLGVFKKLVKNLFEGLDELPMKWNHWLNGLTVTFLRNLIQQPVLQQELTKTLKKDFDSLCEFDKLKQALNEHEMSVITKLFGHTGGWNINLFERVLQNSVRLAWLDHIETKFPILRIASTLSIDQMEEELGSLLEEKQKISKEILQVKAREKAYESLEYNRLNNQVTYRDLHHQVTKKRKLWPVRKLMATFGHELFQLVPCWMASPESVSAIFPMETSFDLVLFDEASQCFAERGIPAMYRGKQVLIAGDSKQLKPFNLYKVRWEEESDDPDIEIDSLLDLSLRYLPACDLQEHYRSQSLELIDFSNRHFYGNRLKMLPDRERYNQRIPAIQYHKVDGVWDQQTNRVEAEAVVAHTLDLINSFPGKTIGIVSFNMPQQTLISDLLEQATRDKQMSLDDATVFVKNIENVQGDERDIIIFSIGYAKDEKGKFAMQFGSLNLMGGENRLNVAVTRARQGIVVFTSIEPSDLKTDDTRNPGPKLLKEYLLYARQVSEGKFISEPSKRLNYHPAWYLKDQIESALKNPGDKNTHIEQSRFPYADLLAEYEGDYTGIILTDDENYHMAYSVKESHAHVPAHIDQKHWHHTRKYSRNFWNDRDHFLSEVVRFGVRPK